jgi:hypothetical protein
MASSQIRINDRPAAWVWTDAGVVLDVEREGSRERLWLNPLLGDLSRGERCAHPLRVEILCWFGDMARLNAGLQVVRTTFARDTWLAAIHRTDDATRLTLYTGAREAVVHERYFAVRAVLRPTAIGLRMTLDAEWLALGVLRAGHPHTAATG